MKLKEMFHRHAITSALALGCIILATTWPTWRETFAQIYSFRGSVALLGCAQDEFGQVNVTASDSSGPNALEVTLGSSCSEALRLYGLDGWLVVKEDQRLGQSDDDDSDDDDDGGGGNPNYATFYRLLRPPGPTIGP